MQAQPIPTRRERSQRDGVPNEEDKWNILAFTVSAPGATEIATDEDVSLRTISVGDYESLFVAEEDPEAIEAERQEGIAHDFFSNGNLYYWTTLSPIIVAAVIQASSTSVASVAGPRTRQEFGRPTRPPPRGACSGLAVLFAYLVDNNFPGDTVSDGHAHALGRLRRVPNHRPSPCSQRVHRLV